MKNIYLLLSLLLYVSTLTAQQIQETLYLHNGSIIRGEIIEQVPNTSLKIRTADGNILVFQMSEIEKISKEEQHKDTKSGRHRGLDLTVDAGYHIATKGGKGMFSTEIGIGKRFNKNFYWGLGTGAFISTDGGDPSIPLTSDFKVYFPLKSTSVTPGGIFRIGYVFNTSKSITTGTGKKAITIEVPDNIMVQIMPGMEIPLSKRVDFNLALGYTHFIPTKGGGGSGAFSIRTGFAFHKSPIRKPKKPIRDRGVQFTVEGGKVNFTGTDEDYEYNGGDASLVITYKLNPHLSFGIGAGTDIVNTYLQDGYKSVQIRDDGMVYQNKENLEENMVIPKVFLKGQYRLTNKRLSPFASFDAGMRFYDEFTSDEALDEPSHTSIYIAPAIGLSLRTTNNSYLELKAGYTLAPSIAGRKGETEYNISNFHFTQISSCKPYKMSAPFISLGFTHTFGWGAKWGKRQ